MHSVFIDSPPIGMPFDPTQYAHGPRYDEYVLESTLFVKNEKSIAWKYVETVGIDFEGESPSEVIQDAMHQLGMTSLEDLRKKIEVYPIQMACHLGKLPKKIPKTSKLRAKDLLRRALILGLCGPTHYNPNRAIIWTNSRLTRVVDLYLPGEFYASH